MKKDLEQDWLKKCLECQHSYHKNDDADTIYCQCRNGKCNYKPKNTFSVKSPEWGNKMTTVEDLTADELESLKQNIKQIKEQRFKKSI